MPFRVGSVTPRDISCSTVQKTRCSWVSVIAVASVLAACGGGGGDNSAATTEPGLCTFTDAGNGTSIQGAAGSQLVDSRGMAYDIGTDCTLVFAECQVNMTGGQVTGQPLEAFTGPDDQPMIFSEECDPIPDPAFSPLSAELIAACASVEGTFTNAVSDTEWTCAEVPLGDTSDRYGEVEAVLAPFCPEDGRFTSGLESDEPPVIAGWSCMPPAVLIEGDLTSVCESSLGGTLEELAPNDWSCVDAPLDEQLEQFDSMYSSLLQFCDETGEYTAEMGTSELPYDASFRCTPLTATESTESAGAADPDTIAGACAALGGTLEYVADDNWTCDYVPLGETTDLYAPIDEALAQFCAAPAVLSSGMRTGEAPFAAGWSCNPA